MINDIKKDLIENSSLLAKASTSKFVPGAQHIYGIRMPLINLLAKKYERGGLPLVADLWKEGAYEEQMLAARILGRVAKMDPARSIRLVETFSKSVSNWAICDCLGMQSLRKLRKTHQTEIVQLSKKLIQLTNPWQRRLALVLLECYTKDATLRPIIEKMLNKVRGDEDYYVKKAVVWLDRNFTKKR